MSVAGKFSPAYFMLGSKMTHNQYMHPFAKFLLSVAFCIDEGNELTTNLYKEKKSFL